ncbi:hypothetical protein V2G26_016207 [Clonostachys chloroleuca]
MPVQESWKANESPRSSAERLMYASSRSCGFAEGYPLSPTLSRSNNKWHITSPGDAGELTEYTAMNGMTRPTVFDAKKPIKAQEIGGHARKLEKRKWQGRFYAPVAGCSEHLRIRQERDTGYLHTSD